MEDNGTISSAAAGSSNDSPNTIIIATADAASAAIPSPQDTAGIARRGSARGRGSRGGRGAGRGRGTKRKRRSSDIIKAEDSDDSKSLSEDEYTPRDTATRSGRSIQKPIALVVPASPSPNATKPRRRRAINTKNPESTVCTVCLRPHSPASNMIVFCDSCNTAYHRYCHQPPIEQVVVDVPDKEWHCRECTLAFRATRLGRRDLYKASDLPDDKLRRELSLLPSAVLVDLLVEARRSAPQIKIQPPSQQDVDSSSANAAMPPPPIPVAAARNYNHPSTAVAYAPKPQNNGDGQSASTPQRPADDELEGGYEDDPPAHYPLPGHGLARLLPPESEHESILIDGNHEVYTHIWQTDPKKANEAVYGVKENQKSEDVKSDGPEVHTNGDHRRSVGAQQLNGINGNGSQSHEKDDDGAEKATAGKQSGITEGDGVGAAASAVETPKRPPSPHHP